MYKGRYANEQTQFPPDFFNTCFRLFYAMPVRIVNARACGRGGIKCTNIAVTGIHEMEKELT